MTTTLDGLLVECSPDVGELVLKLRALVLQVLT